jgi:hypothetical protein
MRMDSDGGASSLAAHYEMVRAAARHSQPQTKLDEQPAGSVPRVGEKSVPPLVASDGGRCRDTVPSRGNTVSTQRFEKRRVLIHELLLFTISLVTRLLVTRILVKTKAAGS